MSLSEDGLIPLDKRRLVTGLKIPDVHKAVLRSAKTDAPISSGTRLRDGSQYSFSIGIREFIKPERWDSPPHEGGRVRVSTAVDLSGGLYHSFGYNAESAIDTPAPQEGFDGGVASSATGLQVDHPARSWQQNMRDTAEWYEKLLELTSPCSPDRNAVPISAQWARVVSSSIPLGLRIWRDRTLIREDPQARGIVWERKPSLLPHEDITISHAPTFFERQKVAPAHVIVDSKFGSDDQPQGCITFALPPTPEGLEAVPWWFWRERDQVLKGGSTILSESIDEACAALWPLCEDAQTSKTLRARARDPWRLSGRSQIFLIANDLIASKVIQTLEDTYGSTVKGQEIPPRVASVRNTREAEQLANGYIITHDLSYRPPHIQYILDRIQKANTQSNADIETKNAATNTVPTDNMPTSARTDHGSKRNGGEDADASSGKRRRSKWGRLSLRTRGRNR